MPGRCSPLNVDPELLACLSVECRAHSENLRAGDPGRAVESAMGGWIGRSRQALATAAQRWTETASLLAARVDEHSEALRLAALAVAEMEAANSRKLRDPSGPS